MTECVTIDIVEVGEEPSDGGDTPPYDDTKPREEIMEYLKENPRVAGLAVGTAGILVSVARGGGDE